MEAFHLGLHTHNEEVQTESQDTPDCDDADFPFPKHWKKRMLQTYTLTQEEYREIDTLEFPLDLTVVTHIVEELISVNINQLPDDILMQIFSHLDVRDRFRVAGVSRRFNNIIRDRFLWKTVDLRSCSGTLDGRTLHRLLTRYFLSGHLRVMYLPYRFATMGVLKRIGKSCKRLKTLSLSRKQLRPNLNFVVLPESLERIIFDECPFSSRYDYNHLELAGNVRSVVFTNYQKCFDLRRGVLKLKNIRELTIKNCHCFLGEGTLIDVSENNPELETISICGVPDLSDSNVQAICTHFKNVARLILRQNIGLTEVCFNSLKTMKTLKTIDIGDNPQFDNETLERFLVEHSKINK